VRGSSGYGKAYSLLDNVEKRVDAVKDMIALVDWVQQQPDLDAGRIVLYGGSYGGFMVLAGLTERPDLWAAGVDIVGISHFVTFLENTSDYRRAHREAEYGSLENDRDFLESISPLNKANRIEAPLFIVHGANDPRVPLTEAQQLADTLERQRVPVELLVFDDEGHGLAKLRNKLVAYPAIAEFLDRHVLGS
jgi:dipeptidyl aminopeptidase/acylaminoacyl peptidase